MLSRQRTRLVDRWDRREFLGAAGSLALTAPLSLPAVASQHRQRNRLILLLLTGGPSHFETWDPKPHAPSNIRGPFRPIRTSVPGVEIGEHFPRMARLARHFAIVRSVHHREAAIHETGLQLMQTGHWSAGGSAYPHYGAMLSYTRGRPRSGVPPFVILPQPLGDMGVNVGHGQGAGLLGQAHEAFSPRQERGECIDAVRRVLQVEEEPASMRERYGRSRFGQNCLLARRLVERGAHAVSVNMFDTVFNTVSWDCHAAGGSLASTLGDYRDTVCPMFDISYAALLSDLDERGLLETTLVVAMGEFGRTPWLNSCGGRDHWPGVWSILFAGGGVRGGQVVGSSDAIGAEPRDRPVTPADVAATIYHLLGVDSRMELPAPHGHVMPVVKAKIIRELI